MREELRCALNGVDMYSLDPRLYIEEIEEEIGLAAETQNRPDGGQRLTRPPERRWLTVTIRFMIKERDRAARNRVMGSVNGWAKEGWLTISTRPGQRLYAVCTQPAGGTALRWNEGARVAFTAYDTAYWRERYPVTAQLTGAAGEAEICPRGTRPCPLEADITNTSGKTVETLRLWTNGRTMTFGALGLAAGKTLRLYCDPRGWLHAETDGEGRLHCRTEDSADMLTLYAGRSNAVGFTADGTCAVTARAWGIYD